MKFSEFAELNEELTNIASKNKKVGAIVNLFGKASLQERSSMISLFTLDFPNIGIGESGLIKRLEEYYQLGNDEIKDLIDHYPSLSEVIELFDSDAEEPADNIDLIEACSFMYQDNHDEAYRLFFRAYDNTPLVGKRWLIRFLLKEPRNGVHKGSIIKSIAKHHKKKQSLIKKASMSNTLWFIDNQLDLGNELDLTVPPGVFRNPMLAKGQKETPVINVPSIIDVKYDGIRTQIHNVDGTIMICNRKGKDITHKFDDIVDDLKEYGPVAKNYVADGEIYPVDINGKPDEFKKIMSRIHGKTQSVIFRTEVKLKLFDLLYFNEKDIAETTYQNRLKLLQENFDHEIVATSIKTNSTQEMLGYYGAAIADGYEGIIIKPLIGKWVAGKRSNDWIKYKPARIEVDAVITGASYGSGKRADVLATYEIALEDNDGSLISIGSVGSGFSDEDLTFFTELYKVSDPNSIIIEVIADILTKDKLGNLGLRFPRFIKYRDDKITPTNIMEVL